MSLHFIRNSIMRERKKERDEQRKVIEMETVYSFYL